MRVLTRTGSILNRTSDVLAFLSAVMLAFVMVIVVVDVVMRDYFGRPMEWVTEIASYALLYITFLVAAWVLRQEGHVKLDLVLNQLSPAGQSLVNMITSIIGAIVFLVIAWYSAQVAWSDFEMGYVLPTPLRLPRLPLMVVIPVGSVLLFIEFLRKAHGYLRIMRRERGHAERGTTRAGDKPC